MSFLNVPLICQIFSSYIPRRRSVKGSISVGATLGLVWESLFSRDEPVSGNDFDAH